MRLERLVKRTAAWALFRGGVLSSSRRRAKGPRAIVLMYHRVSASSNGSEATDPFFPSLPVSVFRAQLEYLASRYPLVHLDALPDWLDAGGEGRPPVALTLDDGYPDTYHVVLPELERLGIPLTVFLATSPPETGRPLWTDRLRYLFKSARAQRMELASLGISSSLATAGERLGALRVVLRKLKRLRPDAMERALGELEHVLEPEGAGPGTLSWKQIHRMTEGPVRLGAHTHHHYLLSRLDNEQLSEEIETSFRLIEQRTGRRPQCFAYPNGAPGDYDARSLDVLKRLGVRCAVTTVNGFVRPGQHLLELPRMYTTEGFLPLFAARLEGWSREVT